MRVPGWVCDPSADLAVTFTPRALAQLAALDEARLQLLRSRAELRAAITQVLSTDPRQDHYVLNNIPIDFYGLCILDERIIQRSLLN